MSTRAQLSETINRLLPGEQNKRIREAILAAATYTGQRTDQLRQTIDNSNRLRTGLLINGTTTILTDTSAELSGYVWVVNFAVKQPEGITALTILAPLSDYVREDYFLGLSNGTIVYRAGTVDTLGNSFPPEYDAATEVILRIVRRNPDGSNDEVEIPEGNNLIDFAEQNIIPYVAGGKLKNSGIQVIFDALNAISGFEFPTPVRGVPAVNDDEFVTKAQLPSIDQYGLLNGGTIQWRGDGLWFQWAPAIVAIGSVLNAPFDEIELTAADPTLNREDLLGWLKVDATNAVPHVITGTPGPTFAPPPYDPTTFVVGISVKIPAAATTPTGITTENVYIDNAQWTVTKSGTGTVDADSTDNPSTGTKAVKSTATGNNYRVRFTRSAVLDLSTLLTPTLGMDLALIAAMQNNMNLSAVFLNDAAAPVSSQVNFIINKASTAYQFVALDLSAFTFTSQEIKHLEIIFTRSGGGTFAGFYLDNVKIQGDLDQPVPTSVSHNSTTNKQGGNALTNEFYHVSKDSAEGLEASGASAADPVAKMSDLPAPGGTLPPGGTTGQVLTKQSAADGDADWETPSGAGAPTPYLTDLDSWPVLKFDKNHRYTHEMAGPVEISAEFLIPVAQEGNFCKLYIKADGTNKPTFTGDFTVIWDNWVNTAGHWNRFYAEYSPEGKVILQIEQAHLGTPNDGSGLTQLTITFEANHTQSHVITNSTEIVIDPLDAEEGYQTILYVKADGANKPFWDSADVVVTYDDYLNEVDVWNRIVLEWRPEGKAIMQLINT